VVRVWVVGLLDEDQRRERAGEEQQHGDFAGAELAEDLERAIAARGDEVREGDGEVLDHGVDLRANSMARVWAVDWSIRSTQESEGRSIQ